MIKKSPLSEFQYSRKLLGKARRLMLKARKMELEPFQITPRQAAFLNAISELGERATLTELSKYHGRAVNTISSQMTEMEADGFIKKVRVMPKSKALRFELTEKGLGAHQGAVQNSSLQEIMSALSERERKHLDALLMTLINRAETISGPNP